MIEPYYERDGVTIYNADCLNVLPFVDSVQVIVTDPPYGVNGAILNPNRRLLNRHNTWHEKADWDKEINSAWCVEACNAASVVFWFGNWRRRDHVKASMPHPLRAEIVWAKDTHVGPPCPLAMRDERIWIFSKNGFKGQHFETTVWDEPIIPTWAHRWHKNEKPLSLMRRLIRFACKTDDLICDPFMGSGTTLVACKLEGRKCIGIEINKDYCEIAVKRLAQKVLPL